MGQYDRKSIWEPNEEVRDESMAGVLTVGCGQVRHLHTENQNENKRGELGRSAVTC